MTGEVLAALCPDCGDQLPVEFLGCPHTNTIDTPCLGEPPGRRHCQDCGVAFWRARRSLPDIVFTSIANTASPTTSELLAADLRTGLTTSLTTTEVSSGPPR